MTHRALLIFLLFIGTPALADIQEVTIPNVGAIAFDIPVLTDVQSSGNAGSEGDYLFTAKAGRITLRITVGHGLCGVAASHNDVLDCFLSRLSAQNAVAPGSLTSNCDARSCHAMYFGVAELGARFKVYNENILFLFGRHPAHIQLSAIDPGEKDMEVMRLFVASFAYGK